MNSASTGEDDLSGTDIIDYNDVWNNGTAPADNYRGCSAGNNDISEDPLFGSYTLQENSPCKDAIRSDPPSPPIDDPVDIDFRGYERPKGDGYDMGAYEYVPPATFEYTLPGGTGEATDYRIFTVPLDLGKGTDMQDQMETVLEEYDPTHWRVFAYSGDRYLEMNSSGFKNLDIVPGMGFWIITLYTDKITFEGKPAPAGLDYKITLSPGWHLIGLPWIDANIDLGNIRVTDGINEYGITSQPTGNQLTQKFVWSYSGGSNYDKLDSAADTLDCGPGYWIKVLADREITLIIPHNAETPESPFDMALDDLTSPPGEAEPLGDVEDPPPPPGATPSPDIKANSEDGPVTVVHGTQVSVVVSLDAGNWSNRQADWWVAADTPFGWYSYVHPRGWIPRINPCIQTGLFDLTPPFEVLNMVLPAGEYTFYFAVDGNADKKADATWMDSVGVTVKE
ncbi:MAG: choice-of-anchor Q domain-containing protein [Deltaproteobacteria bacterium]|nr:choice-of-anchor Q domain-containing protein [Deltaproteobacteria bacterium]